MRIRMMLVLVGALSVASCSAPQEPVDATFPPHQSLEVEDTTTTARAELVTTTVSESSTVPAVDPTEVPDLTEPGAAPTTTVASTTVPPTNPSVSSTTAATPTTELGTLRSLSYVEVAEVDYPVDLAPVPGTDLIAIASKEGRIWLHGEDGLSNEPFLDIRDRVRNRGEQGLLGIAFASDYAESGRLFVHYSDQEGRTVLAEYLAESVTFDADSEVVLLRIPQPAANHNGGTIAFGPHGYLYMGMGDGGGANDRFGHGQDDGTPLAALLKLDVAVRGVVTPVSDHPFPEPTVWAIGLRNPWRFTIDHLSGQIVIADVGQDNFEEVSVAPIDAPGLNYGWPITEGLHCFRPPSGCEAGGLTLPVLEVEHGDAGTCSITGGVVYRGVEIPELYGHYLFSDYCGGYLRSFPLESPTDPPTDWTDQVGIAGQVTAFGTDAAGEVYVLTAAGPVLRLVAER